MRWAMLALAVLPATAGESFLFVYFREPANMGAFYAVSDDGYKWKELNGGKPWIGIQRANELMRDPFVTRGPDGEFQMVWTWAWRGQTLGCAHSKDLVHWSEQREIPIMRGTGAKNTWAPEIYWDESKKHWLVIWSSVIEERHYGNRLYYATTEDFQTFSEPKVYFDMGYMAIDGTILRDGEKYYLVFKDERAAPLRKSLKIAEGPSLMGPWGQVSRPFTPSWSEGPSALKIGDSVIVYYDHYRPPLRYEAMRSRDMRTWEDVTGEMSFPEHCKHGSFLRITEEERRRIEAASGK